MTDQELEWMYEHMDEPDPDLHEYKDGYGCYEDTKEGLVLTAVNMADERTSYHILEGCTGIEQEAFKNQQNLEEIWIPSSVKWIAEGALSNGESWAHDKKGIRRAYVADGNTSFCADVHGLYECLAGGKRKLLRYLSEESFKEVKNSYSLSNGTLAQVGKAFTVTAPKASHGFSVSLPEEVTQVGENAFLGYPIKEVIFETKEAEHRYHFPVSHSFFLEKLLQAFGKKGKLYDFTDYDAFLLRPHFNPERIAMLCDRLRDPYELPKEREEALRKHLLDHMEEAVISLIGPKAIDELQSLMDLSLIDGGNVDAVIELLNRSNEREMLSRLMHYKNSMTEPAEFDFSI